MSKVSPFSSFRLEDFPSQRDWIDTLFLPLNTILQQASSALNAGITFGDNIPTFTKTIAGTNLTLPLSFKVDGGLIPTQMIVASATKDGNPIAMVGAWSFSTDTATVSKLYELTDSGNLSLSTGSKYSINLRFN